MKDVLDLKLLRDLRRLWAQALAIALVVAGGVTSVVMAVGSHHALEQTRDAYYERYGFADVFATVRRAPDSVAHRLEQIPGVAAVEPRVAQLALLDIPGFREPAMAQLLSLPDTREQRLNRVYLRQGRLPDPGRTSEVLVDAYFARAHGFEPGSRFGAILNGRKHELLIAGTAMSPEFIFAVAPGDIMPDNRRFGVIWMPERALAAAYDLKDGFSSVSLKLTADTSEPEVIRQVDEILASYGGRAAYGRKDQPSHAWLDHELDMLDNMSRTLPPIFLLVSAFLINLTLGRLVTLEREQVGLFKALGYTNRHIALHYLKFVLAIVAAGVVMGSIAGTWIGSFLTVLFADYFHFPFLIFHRDATPYLMGAGLSLLAAALGTMRAIREIVSLPPAIAMRPPSPPTFRHALPLQFSNRRTMPQPVVMTLRNMIHHPVRTAFTALGIAFATGILVVSLFTRDSMETLVDVTYFLADRQDATLSFVERRSMQTVAAVARLPGVLVAEPAREVPIRIRRGPVERRVVLAGKPRDADLSRVIDVNLRPVRLPEDGIAISAVLAQLLGVHAGDTVEVDLLEGQRRTVELTVVATIEDYFGIRAMMDDEALARMMRESRSVNSVHVSLDDDQLDAFYQAVKASPWVNGLVLQRFSLRNFREAVAIFVTSMATIYAALAALIAFGVVYNNARISLSESARDLASLRVLGYRRGEVLWILLLELAFLTLIAQPIGWAIGYGLSWIMMTQLGGELMRVRLVIEPSTYVLTSVVVVMAALLSALVVRRRVYALDLIAVLKTRD